MKKERCIIIPAIKKNAVIPDQLVKKLAGVTLIQRALNTAKALFQDSDIYVVTDSEEISLICQRNNVNYQYDKSLRLNTANILKELKFYMQEQARSYNNIILYRASTPLVDHHDIQNGYEIFVKDGADILVTLKKQEHCIWEDANGHPDHLIFSEKTEPILIEIKSFFILKSDILNGDSNRHAVLPYYLDEKAIEINSYQDWWICEKLLKKKRILFVVAGYPAIGLGHIYRALTLAHEIADHNIQFLCTKDSEMALKRIAEKDYPTVLQTSTELHEDVLRLQPDLVINDILDTDHGYVKVLKDSNIKVVNFEDTGTGANEADLVINALYSSDDALSDKYLYGHDYFCLRDEFMAVEKNHFNKNVRNLLITFGGTDPSNFTLQTLESVINICKQREIHLYIVTGPGYLHKEHLQTYINTVDYEAIKYIHQTGIISSIMEKADLAISSAGRTVYELAHMRVPAIIMSQHEREETHTFARSGNGFEYIGLMNPFNSRRLIESFNRMLDTQNRKKFYDGMKKFRFERNKKRVIKRIMALLDEG